MVITRTVEMHAQLVGYDFKKKGLPTDNNIAVENSKVSNDYFWKTNKYTDQDVFGRTLDLTALINKPDGGCGLLRIQYYRVPGIKFCEGYL